MNFKNFFMLISIVTILPQVSIAKWEKIKFYTTPAFCSIPAFSLTLNQENLSAIDVHVYKYCLGGGDSEDVVKNFKGLVVTTEDRIDFRGQSVKRKVVRYKGVECGISDSGDIANPNLSFNITNNQSCYFSSTEKLIFKNKACLNVEVP